MEKPPIREPLSPWPFAGMIGLACVAFCIGATPLVVGAPWWAVLLLAIGWFTARPRAVALLPVAVALVWLATVLGGATYLGWA